MTIKNYLMNIKKEHPENTKIFKGCNSACPMARTNIIKLYGDSIEIKNSSCRSRFINLLNGNKTFEHYLIGEDYSCFERIQKLYEKYDKVTNLLDIE